MSSQTRRKLRLEEIQVFESLKSVIQQLDSTSTFAFAGRYLVSQKEKSSIRLFIEENGEPKLRSFPLDEEAARAIYDAAGPNGHGYGHLLTANQFALTGDFPIPHWIMSRLSNNYTEPLETRLEGLVALQKGDQIPLSAHLEYSEYWYGDWSTHVGYLYLCLPTTFAGGKVSITKPQQDEDDLPFTRELDWAKSALGEELHSVTSRPNPSSKASKKGWQIPWLYFEPPAKLSIAPVENGHMLMLRYKIRAADEDDPRGGWLPSIDPAVDVGMKAIKQKLLRILADESVLSEGGQLGFGLSESYDIPDTAADDPTSANEEKDADDDDGDSDEGAKSNDEGADDEKQIIEHQEQFEQKEDGDEEEAKEDDGKEGLGEEDQSKDEEEATEEAEEEYIPEPPRQYSQEEEKDFLSSLPAKFRGADKYLIETLKDLGVLWELRGIWAPYPADEEEEARDEEEEALEGKEQSGKREKSIEKEDEAETEGLEKEDDDANDQYDDPSIPVDIWTSPSGSGLNLSLIQGSYIPGSLRKALLAKGVKKDEHIFWANTPCYTPITCSYMVQEEFTTIWESWSQVMVGAALIVQIPPVSERGRFSQDQ